MNIMGPEKAKEFNTGLSGILFKDEAAANDCVTQNTPSSPGLVPSFLTKACDLAASLVTQFCKIPSINNYHKDLSTNLVVTQYVNQRQLNEKQQNQLAGYYLEWVNIH
jgi:hypothetical protein